MSGIFFENQTLEPEEQELKDKGYTYLGWQVHTGNSQDLAHHKNLGHKEYEKNYSPWRGSHRLYWCDDCKIWWNIDSSD